MAAILFARAVGLYTPTAEDHAKELVAAAKATISSAKKSSEARGAAQKGLQAGESKRRKDGRKTPAARRPPVYNRRQEDTAPLLLEIAEKCTEWTNKFRAGEKEFVQHAFHGLPPEAEDRKEFRQNQKIERQAKKLFRKQIKKYATRELRVFLNSRRDEKIWYEEVEGSIFQVLSEKAIVKLVTSQHNLMHQHIVDMAQVFLDATDPENEIAKSCMKEKVTADEAVLKVQTSLSSQVPWIMDQTCREPATSTPFGHTVQTKYYTFKIMQRLGMKDIAVCGLYYRDNPTPECLFLEYLKSKGENMSGTVAMFNPFGQERATGVRLMRHYKVPNAFFDLALMPSDRFPLGKDLSEDEFMDRIYTEVLDAVLEVDAVLVEQGLEGRPWRADENLTTPGQGEISINFVDIMEYLKPQPPSYLDVYAWQRLQRTIQRWQENAVFRSRVVAILTEEGRGVATHQDYGFIIAKLRTVFPSNEYRIAIHCHAGNLNAHDVAPIECMRNGASGVWAALIPQAAQSGHNNWLSFLDTLMSEGNPHAWSNFDLRYAVNAAKQIYHLNFNTVQIPQSPALWGTDSAMVHSAFDRAVGWRARPSRTLYKDFVHKDFQAKMKVLTREAAEREDAQLHEFQAFRDSRLFQNPLRPDGDRFRVAALVSDDDTWANRLHEIGLLDKECEDHLQLVSAVRRIAYAIMNANIRADFNCPQTLTLLWSEAQRKEVSPALASCKLNH